MQVRCRGRRSVEPAAGKRQCIRRIKQRGVECSQQTIAVGGRHEQRVANTVAEGEIGTSAPLILSKELELVLVYDRTEVNVRLGEAGNRAGEEVCPLLLEGPIARPSGIGIGQRVEAVVAGGGGLAEAVHVFVFAVVVEAGAEFQRMLVQNLGDVAEPIMVPVVVVVGSEADNALPIIEANDWNAVREAERKSRLDIRRICRGHRSGWSADYGDG